MENMPSSRTSIVSRLARWGNRLGKRCLAVGLVIERGRRGNELASMSEAPDFGAEGPSAERKNINSMSDRGSAERE